MTFADRRPLRPESRPSLAVALEVVREAATNAVLADIYAGSSGVPARRKIAAALLDAIQAAFASGALNEPSTSNPA